MSSVIGYSNYALFSRPITHQASVTVIDWLHEGLALVNKFNWVHDGNLTISINGKIASHALLRDSLPRLKYNKTNLRSFCCTINI